MATRRGTEEMMQRVRDYCLTGVGVFALSLGLSLSGISQTVASGLQKGVQQVLITNKSMVVRVDASGNTVQDVPSSPLQPVQFGARIDFKTSATGEETTTAYTVPSGKRLVIEFVSAHYSQQTSDAFAQAGFSVGSGPSFFIPLTNEVGRGAGFDFEYVGSEMTRVYADAGQQIVIHAPHSAITATPASVALSFSGYLVNA